MRIVFCLVFVFTAILCGGELGFADSGKVKTAPIKHSTNQKASQAARAKTVKKGARKKALRTQALPGPQAKPLVRPKAKYKEQPRSAVGKKNQADPLLDDEDSADQPKNTFSDIPKSEDGDNGEAGTAEAVSPSEEE